MCNFCCIIVAVVVVIFYDGVVLLLLIILISAYACLLHIASYCRCQEMDNQFRTTFRIFLNIYVGISRAMM